MNLTTKILFLFANFCTIFSSIQEKLTLGVWIIAIFYYLYFIESKKFKTKYNSINPQYYKQVEEIGGDQIKDPYFIVSYCNYLWLFFAFIIGVFLYF